MMPASETTVSGSATETRALKPVLASTSEIRRLELSPEQWNAVRSGAVPSTAVVRNMSEVTPMAQAATGGEPIVVGGEFLESKMSEDEMRAARDFAKANAPGGRVQTLEDGSDNLGVNNNGKGKGEGKKGPKLRAVIDSIGAEDCCVDDVPFSATVPPDPDMAAGPDHLVAVVNVSFEIYDKEGNVLQPATSYGTLFQGVNPFGACEGSFPFDPDVVYDESTGQFIIGVDGGGAFYCIGITADGDPMGDWNLYSFLAIEDPNEFFDFPHMGVGVDAIYVGSNEFLFTPGVGFSFLTGAAYAVNKADMIAGDPITVVRQNVPRFDGTPQPANLHGAAEGTFPTSGPHYIMTEVFDGITHSVYAWDDPFGANSLTLLGDVDLAEASGVPCPAFSCFPVSVPQAGSAVTLAGNDFRGQETKYRNGSLWTTQTIACNPTGMEAVNCVRWAEIDPTQVGLPSSTDGVIQAGVFSSPDGVHRWFPSIAVNACGDMAVGYSKSSTDMFPSVALTGQRRNDRPGRVRSEVDVMAGTESYRSFQDPTSANRWGDYSGMTIDPNGVDFWYIGEYAGESENQFANWKNVIAKANFGCGLGKAKNKNKNKK